MTVQFLLDTNIVSEPLRRKPSEAVVERFHIYQAVCAIPSIVWHELLYGMERLPKSAKREAVEQYLIQVLQPTLPILDYDGRAAHWHAIERARLAFLGRTPPFVDGQIAAVAAVNDLALVTRNTRDFVHFSNLTVVNWFAV